MSCSVDHEFISGLSKDRTNILDSTQVDHWNWDPHIKEETLKSYINRVLETRIPLVKKERGGMYLLYMSGLWERKAFLQLVLGRIRITHVVSKLRSWQICIKMVTVCDKLGYLPDDTTEGQKLMQTWTEFSPV